MPSPLELRIQLENIGGLINLKNFVEYITVTNKYVKMEGNKSINAVNLQKTTSSNPHQLKVVTLNYCGIMNNPFQFYCESFINELKEISQIFDDLLHQYYKLQKNDKFVWSMGKVEQKIRLGRYSPSFDLHVGIQGNRFLSRKQFQEKWEKSFEDMVKKGAFKFQPNHIETTRTYDFIYFHTLLKFVYKKNAFEDLIKQNPKKYIDTLKKFYDQSYLDDKKKLQKIKNSLLKIQADVLFLQEFSPLFQEYISQNHDYHYKTDESKDTMTVVRRKSFKDTQIDVGKILNAEQIKSLNWTQKTCIYIVDNIILINAHLSSNKQKNSPQIQGVKANLLKLKKQLPNYHFILGGDLNSFLKPELQFNHTFSMYPMDEKQITTTKMRTVAQGQYEKGNVKNEQSKDKIISDFVIKKDSGSVTYIDNKTKPDLKSFIPTDNHPFDHFVVSCTLIRP